MPTTITPRGIHISRSFISALGKARALAGALLIVVVRGASGPATTQYILPNCTISQPCCVQLGLVGATSNREYMERLIRVGKPAIILPFSTWVVKMTHSPRAGIVQILRVN